MMDSTGPRRSKTFSPSHLERDDLPLEFAPGDDDVICGKGKSCFNHLGNKRFRQIVEDHLDRYLAASSKLEKSTIVSSIIQIIRRNSPDGGFVKKDPCTGRWFEVGEHLSREKVGQTIRDALHFKYKSSTKYKRKRRLAARAQMATAEAQKRSARQQGKALLPSDHLSAEVSDLPGTDNSNEKKNGEVDYSSTHQELLMETSGDNSRGVATRNSSGAAYSGELDCNDIKSILGNCGHFLQQEDNPCDESNLLQRIIDDPLPQPLGSPLQQLRGNEIGTEGKGWPQMATHVPTAEAPLVPPSLLQEMLRVQQNILRLQEGMLQGNNDSFLY